MNWFGRKFRNAPNEMLSESTGEPGDLGQHLGDWCMGVSLPEGSVHNPEATLVTSSLEPLPTHTRNGEVIEYDFGHEGGLHAPVLDLDLEHVYYESSTPGHAALLLNVRLTWEQYSELIDVLESCGIIQHGFAEATCQRGYSAVRTPWTKKIPKPYSNETDPDPMDENLFG